MFLLARSRSIPFSPHTSFHLITGLAEVERKSKKDLNKTLSDLGKEEEGSGMFHHIEVMTNLAVAVFTNKENNRNDGWFFL